MYLISEIIVYLINMSKKNKRKTIFLILFSFGLFVSSTNIGTPFINADFSVPIAYLTFKTSGGGVRPDYGFHISHDLSKIGIQVTVKVEEWSVFVGTLLLTHDFDLVVVGLSGGGSSPDMRSVYTADGSLNIFQLDYNLPYYNESEYLQNLGVTLIEPSERRPIYYEWQELMMDKIIPLMPLYAPKSYVGTWANTEEYNVSWGIVDSLPYMYYDGYHEGQVSLDEFNMADANWRDLNPLIHDDTSSAFIWSLMAEPILQFSPYLVPSSSGLVHDWEMINATHYKFFLRDNLFWNPSYNVTVRTAISPPLETITDGELMVGLKGEYSNGTNQQVTAKDAVFTFLAWNNPIVSNSTIYHNWISDIYIDPLNELAFHIHVDEDYSTPEEEIYSDFWHRMSFEILPEFFLNSTDSTITYTAGGVRCIGLYPEIVATDTWKSFSISAFGCGKYLLDYFIHDSKTVLTNSPYWMNIGAKDGSIQYLNISTINVHAIPDASLELSEFKAGILDWTGLTIFPTERKLLQEDPRFDVQSFITASFSFMGFNLKRSFIGGSNNFIYLTEEGKEEYTRGLAVRKAIIHAIDREKMNQEEHGGEYFNCHSVVYPFTSYYYYDGFQYEYNQTKSLEWLAAAGYYEFPTPTPTITETPTPTIPTSTIPLSTFSIITSIIFLPLLYYYRKSKKT